MKTVLITGASAGIGKATAEAFLNAGWRVGLIARRAEVLEQMAVDHGAHAKGFPADVTNAKDLERAFADFVAWAGHLDVLFNNAGSFGPSGPIDEIDLDDWDQVLSVNLRGMFMAARLAFKTMRQQSPMGGRIINNGSISAHVPRPGSVCYTTTKHAITGMTKALSLDGRPFDIGCGQIDIGNARTELLDDLQARALVANPKSLPQPMMDVSHAANSVVHMAELPPEANVQFMTVMATKMPYIGRG